MAQVVWSTKGSLCRGHFLWPSEYDNACAQEASCVKTFQRRTLSPIRPDWLQAGGKERL